MEVEMEGRNGKGGMEIVSGVWGPGCKQPTRSIQGNAKFVKLLHCPYFGCKSRGITESQHGVGWKGHQRMAGTPPTASIPSSPISLLAVGVHSPFSWHSHSSWTFPLQLPTLEGFSSPKSFFLSSLLQKVLAILDKPFKQLLFYCKKLLYAVKFHLLAPEMTWILCAGDNQLLSD